MVAVTPEYSDCMIVQFFLYLPFTMKTGDRVKSKIKWDDGGCHIKIGDQGVIDIIRPQNKSPIHVIFDNGMDETFQECNLELVENPLDRAGAI